MRYEFTNADGQRVGIIARRSGGFEVVAYSATDPDESRPLLRLTRDEADTVAEILGAPRIAERFADLTKEVPGLAAGQVVVPPGLRTPTSRWARPARGPAPARRSWPSCAARTSSPHRRPRKCCGRVTCWW
nr:hypothetical protein GCM10017745_50260 [Saccharothrix mutabilis subsp. capreolus]